MLGYGSKQELLRVNLEQEIYVDLAERTAIFADLESRSKADAVAHWRRKDGKPVVVRIAARAIRGDDGRVRHCEAIAEDITERRSLEEQLRQAQKMEAVGRISLAVAN